MGYVGLFAYLFFANKTVKSIKYHRIQNKILIERLEPLFRKPVEIYFKDISHCQPFRLNFHVIATKSNQAFLINFENNGIKSKEINDFLYDFVHGIEHKDEMYKKLRKFQS